MQASGWRCVNYFVRNGVGVEDAAEYRSHTQCLSQCVEQHAKECCTPRVTCSTLFTTDHPSLRSSIPPLLLLSACTSSFVLFLHYLLCPLYSNVLFSIGFLLHFSLRRLLTTDNVITGFFCILCNLFLNTCHITL